MNGKTKYNFRLAAAAVVVAVSAAAGFFMGKSPGKADGEGAVRLDFATMQDAPLDEAGWRKLNETALSLYGQKDPEGTALLGRFLKWNLLFRRGVDLRGVDLRYVFSTINARNRMKLPEFSEKGGSAGEIVSFERCQLEGAKHPGTILRWVKFEGASFDAATLRDWAGDRGGKGFEAAFLDNVDLSSLNEDRFDFRGANLSYTGIQPIPKDGSQAELPDRRYEECVLDGINFGKTDLTGLSLRRCILIGSSISGEQILQAAECDGGAGIVGAALPEVDLRGRKVAGVFLTDVDTKPVKADVPQSFQQIAPDGSEADWCPLFRSGGGGDIGLDMIPKGQGRGDWTRKLSWSFTPSDLTLDEFASEFEKNLRGRDAGARIKRQSAAGSGRGVLLAADLPGDMETSLTLISPANGGMETLSYTAKKEGLTKEELVGWLSRIRKAKSVPTGGRIPSSLFGG